MAIPSEPQQRVRRTFLDYVHTKTFTPREYQVELLDSAKERNVIICMGTGTGKTFIAVMLIREMSKLTREDYETTGKRTIFLAPTVHLVQQQKRVLSDHTDLKVRDYYGSLGVSLWTDDEWKAEFKKYHILIMTPDIFKDLLFHNIVTLSKINLLVIDECHRAVKNYSYKDIMRVIAECSPSSRPKILGLSASLLNSNCKPEFLEKQIRNLEITLLSNVEAASSLSSFNQYISKPKEEIFKYKKASFEFSSLQELRLMLNSALSFLADTKLNNEQASPLNPTFQPKRYLIEITYVLVTLGPWCAQKVSVILMNEISRMLQFQPISDINVKMLVMARTVLEWVNQTCEQSMADLDPETRIIKFVPDKLKRVLEVLKPYKPNEEEIAKINLENELLLKKLNTEAAENGLSPQLDIKGHSTIPPNSTNKSRSDIPANNSQNKYNCYYNNFHPKRRPYMSEAMAALDAKALCGIIFVRQRVTAYVLSLWLNEVGKYLPDFQFLRSSFVVGKKINSFERVNANQSSFMSSQHQEETLRKFRIREYNLLVATSVIEEGLDVPKCNFVLRFDPPDDFRSYIQSKGRARAPDSKYCLLVCDSDEAFSERLENFRKIESILMDRVNDREPLTEEEIADHLADQVLPAYIPVDKEGGARVTMSSAIALVNRYCCKLPSDTFTRLTPKWNISKANSAVQSLYSCTILLPINSPLKEEVLGKPMKSKKLAKMAAALEVCKKLHEIGELDDNLLPVGKEAVKFEEELSNSVEIEQVPQGAPRPGTTKRRQYYYKMVAEALQGTSPSTGTTCLLYNFSMKLTCPIPEEQNTRGRKIHNPSDTTRGFGILTTKLLPPVCSFPVFTRSGEVTIELDFISSDLRFTENQLSQLMEFHRYTFQDVLRLEKYPMIFNAKESDNSFYVVPLNNIHSSKISSIDWDFVHLISVQKANAPKKADLQNRSSFTFENKDYEDAVVMPWYRNLDKPQFFYVAEICSELTPLSDFPDFGYDTFKDYYQEKYSIKILNATQPLLDVDHTSARLNLLTPRYVNRKGMTLPTSSEHTKKAKRENLQQKQILIPELCVVHPFPASLWRKAVCLPCILYRLNSLLLAEQLRLTVAHKIGVGTITLNSDFKWSPLDFGWTLAEVLQKSQEQALKEEEEHLRKTAEKAKLKASQPIKPLQNSTGMTFDSTWTKTLENTGTADFIIDTFDPTAVHIPDNDDFLADEEIAHINFPEALGGTIAGLPLGTWGKNIETNEDDGTEVRIRYGSPSNFEGTGWDSEWDMDIDESNVFRVNLPGLGYISAPSGFNIQGLSHDLATCRYDDLYDSDFDDDEESIYDEMESEYNTVPQPKNDNNQEKNQDASNNGPVSGEMFVNNGNDCSNPPKSFHGNVINSEWLSSCSEDNHENESIIIDISNDTDTDVRQGSKINSSDESFSMISEAIRHIENPKLPEMKDDSDDDSDSEEDNETVPHLETVNVNTTLKQVSLQTAPAFGELLPEREALKDEESKVVFRVHFDDQPNLSSHPGPSPSIVLQAFTMSNANDGINLERLETVGDSFLKYAITAYLYCTYTGIHEGKLSYLRSKQISNLNLYRLGKKCGLGQLMIASKFDPNDNWLPPCYTVPRGLEQAFIDSGMPAGHWNIGNMKNLTAMDEEQIRKTIMEEKHQQEEQPLPPPEPEIIFGDNPTPYIRYNLLTQQSIPDKSIADCVEALIGAYLISCGPRGALLFMSWMGLHVLPDVCRQKEKDGVIVTVEDRELKNRYGYLKPPKSPLLHYVANPFSQLNEHLSGFEEFEKKINYTFRDRAYLLQAFTHASYHYNRLTDCYQRLEFLGDAVLDYLITRHLYEDPQQHYPGVLTDLRSALVNNTFFASLAVKYDFHKYFKAISPGLFGVISKFVDMKRNNPGFVHFEEYYLEEEECEEAEEVEVPKALGDIFESVAGAIYLDSGMSLDTVWRVYYAMMKPEIEYFSIHVPKSPIRELLETYPQTARFDRAEMTLAGKVRIRVEVVGNGQFVGIGRNKRIAKCTAAKRALRALKKIDIHAKR